MSLLSEMCGGFKWLGHEVAGAVRWVPKGIAIVTDVAKAGETLLPEGVQIITDVENLVLDAIKDGGQAVSAGQQLVTAITEAASNHLTDIAENEAVLAAFKGFVSHVSTNSTWTDVLAGLTRLISDYDTFGASAKAALAKIEADA